MDVGKAFYYNQEPKQLARSSFFYDFENSGLFKTSISRM